jgi:hypothetical protein
MFISQDAFGGLVEASQSASGTTLAATPAESPRDPNDR